MIKNLRVFFFIVLCFLFTIDSYAQNKNNKLTQADVVKAIAEISRKTNTIIGVTAIHIEKNQKISYNGNLPFFMASTIKVPIAVVLLQRVDQKKESLNRVVQLTSNHAIPGSGRLDYTLNKRPVRISLKQLLNLMLVVSDNTASDAILQQLNGPNAVLAKLNQLGFHSILVKRSILQMYLDSHGGTYASIPQPHNSVSFERALNRIAMPRQILAWKIFQRDLRDTTTPNDMAFFLESLYEGKLLSVANTKLLIEIMENCKTGRSRIKGLLPRKTIVAHKTGTWSIYSKAFLTHPDSPQLFRYVSDVGVITLPKKKGHIAIAIYVKSTGVSDYERTRVIAEVSRKIYDYFLYGNKT